MKQASTKTVNPGSQSGFAGDTLSWTWSITWVSSFDKEINHAVSGVITVSNPNPEDALTVDVSDYLSGTNPLADDALAASLAEVAKVVTGFTLAHSITLALAVLGYVRPQPAPVEALIGLSIGAFIGLAEGLLTRNLPRALRTGLFSGLLGLAVYTLTPDPTDSQVLYATTPLAIHKTTDGGRSWAAARQPLRTLLSFGLALMRSSPINSRARTAGSSRTARDARPACSASGRHSKKA